MAYKILLNDEEFHFGEDGLPCLVHYKEKQGGSQFTVTLVADLFLQGSKILFRTAYPYAKDNLIEQTNGMEYKIFFAENKEDLIGAEKYQAISLKRGDGDLFLEALQTLGDIKDRVVLVKNFEVFKKNILDSSIMHEKIILSGDIDKSMAKKHRSDKLCGSASLFSTPARFFPFKVPELGKYTGYLKTADKEGLVQLEM